MGEHGKQETNLQQTDLIQTKKGKKKKKKLSKRRRLNVSWPCRQGGESKQTESKSEQERGTTASSTDQKWPQGSTVRVTDGPTLYRKEQSHQAAEKQSGGFTREKGPARSLNAHKSGRLQHEDDHNVGPSGCIKTFFFSRTFIGSFPTFQLSD